MIFLLAACVESNWADQVLYAPGADPTVPFADPSLATNGARGAGFSSGGTDVYSLTLDGRRPELVLGFSGRRVVDTNGPDFVVYENGFEYGSGSRFMDPIVVGVSADGETFVDFPHRFLGGSTYSADPTDWEGFAGTTPTARNEESKSPPAHRSRSGGDRFDLIDLPDGAIRDAVLEEGVAAIRLRPAGTIVDPFTEQLFPVDPVSNGPDIDAVYAWAFIFD